MAEVAVAARNFELGFQSDVPRDQLPRGAAYRMVDWIPLNGAPLRKRGGWTYASRDLNAVSAITRVEAVGWAPFPAEGHLIAISNNGKLFKVKQFDGTAVANAGLLISSVERTNPRHPPFWHRDRMIIPDSLLNQLNGTPGNVRKYYDSGGGTYVTADVAGTPPQFTCGASWGDYIIGANGYITGTRYANRVWWSDVGAPDAWTPTASYWDFPEEIIAVSPRSNLLMFFGYTGVHLLLGAIPPPGGDLTARYRAFEQGCFDAKTVARYRDYTLWANNVGVWRTDGTTLTDLTEQGGISLYWQNLVASFSPFGGWQAAAGVYRGYYFISIINASGVPVTTLVCDLDRLVWFELGNFGSSMFASRPAGPGSLVAQGFEEMFFAGRTPANGGVRVNNTSPIWSPASANASDADGTAVAPVLETPYFKQGGSGLKRFRRAYFNYEMPSAGAPTLQISYVDAPEVTGYTLLGSVPKQSKFARVPLQVRKKALGMAFKIAQSGASDDTRLHEIELEGHPLEPSR